MSVERLTYCLYKTVADVYTACFVVRIYTFVSPFPWGLAPLVLHIIAESFSEYVITYCLL